MLYSSPVIEGDEEWLKLDPPWGGGDGKASPMKDEGEKDNELNFTSDLF